MKALAKNLAFLLIVVVAFPLFAFYRLNSAAIELHGSSQNGQPGGGRQIQIFG